MQELPPLPLAEWRDTLETLHRWMQIVGKVKLALTPPINHFWNVTFDVSAHGLSTGAIPVDDHSIEMEFDFVEDILRIRPTTGPAHVVALRPRSVADFYTATMQALHGANASAKI